MFNVAAGQQGRRNLFVLALVTATAALSFTPSHASHVGDGLQADQVTVAASDQLLRSLLQWERTPAASRASATASLALLARGRQDQLLALLEKNPQVAAARFMPKALRDRMPAEAATYVEQEVSLQGTVLARIQDNFAKGTSQTNFRFQPGAGGSAMALVMADPSAKERELLGLVNAKVSLGAVRVGQRLVVTDKQRLQRLAAGSTTIGTSPSGSIQAATVSPIQGDQSTLVVMANFSDAAISCTQADLQNRIFGTSGATLNEGYRQSSSGLVTFSGRVIGPFNINYSSTGVCDPDGWTTALNAAALAAGFNPSSYKRVSYATPANANCGWSGLATLGGTTPTSSWVQACTATGVFSHEIGHNLTFHHASTPTSEYGDYSDPMGAGRLVQFNAANRVMAGWLTGSQVRDVTLGGTYALTATASTAATSPQVLRLAKPDTAETYYVSMRQPIGVDTVLLSAYQNALSIHRATGTLPARTVIVAIVPPGQSWTDTANGIQIQHQGVVGETATVGVTLGTAACQRSAPVIRVAPSSQTGAPGTPLVYTATITNANTSACGSSSFVLSQRVPSGFSASFGASTLPIAPGSSASTSWTVSSASSTPDGTYDLQATAADASSGLSATAHASDVVYTAMTCTRAAPAVAVSPTSQSGKAGTTLPYTITVTNRDSSGCGNSTFNLGQALPSGFSGQLGATTVTLAPGATSSSTWSVASATTVSAGTYALSAQAAASGSSSAGSGTASGVIVASDTTPPSLVITSPSAGATVSGRSVSITAAAGDTSGIQAVEFYIGNSLLARDTSSPYAASWNLRKAGKGSHTITVRAIDLAGNKTDQTISVTVQ